MRLHWYFCILYISQKLLVIFKQSVFNNDPIILFVLLQYSDVIDLLEYNKYLINELTMLEFPNDHSISYPEDIKAIGFISIPLAINILTMTDIDNSRVIKFAIFPIRGIKW